jgi:hypothetical protein
MILLLSNCELFAQSVVWAYSFGGSGSDLPAISAIDGNDHTYLTGSFENTVDFDPGDTKFMITSPQNENAFITKTSPNGDLIWAKAFIASGRSGGMSVTVSPDGYLYATGYFYGIADFNPSEDEHLLGPTGTAGLYIVKLDLDGNFVWAKSINNIGQDFRSTIRANINDDVIVVCAFTNTIDADPGPGLVELTSKGKTDSFILKLDPNGNYIWVKHFGGGDVDQVRTLAFDLTGNIYIAGTFQGTSDFDPGPQTFLLSSRKGSLDGFVAKLSPDGDLLWAANLGGDMYDDIFALHTDSFSNVFAIGFFRGIGDFDPDSMTTNLLTSAGRSDVFICKLDQDGNFVWAKRVGSSEDDLGYGIAIGDDQSIYVAGEFRDTVVLDFAEETHRLISNGSSDVFVLKLDIDGNYIWANSLGGKGRDGCFSLLVDSKDNLVISGYHQDTVRFFPNAKETVYASRGAEDIFVVKLSHKETVGSANEIFNTPLMLVTLLPNPTSGLIRVNLGKKYDLVKLMLLDGSGSLIDSRQYYSTTEIDLTVGGPPGLYLIAIEANGIRTIHRIILH